ncbi:MAG: hypothetical protein WEC59_02020 [Salibacteraceae bacterium]
MARSPQTFNKRQREKDKQKRKKEKRERMDERKQQRAESDDSGVEIDWSSAPENATLSEKEEAKKAEIKKKNSSEDD